MLTHPKTLRMTNLTKTTEVILRIQSYTLNMKSIFLPDVSQLICQVSCQVSYQLIASLPCHIICQLGCYVIRQGISRCSDVADEDALTS